MSDNYELKRHLEAVECQIKEAKKSEDKRLLRNLHRERRQIRESLGYKRER